MEYRVFVEHPLPPSPRSFLLVLLTASVTAAVTSLAVATPEAPGNGRNEASHDASLARIPPDPPPMSERGQWILDFRWDKGEVYLLSVHKVELPTPQLTPRAMGRFAVELFEGPTLIERVRFDFPLLGAGEQPDAGWSAPPSLEKKLTSRIGVMFPSTVKGTKLELWDRASDRRWSLPWPPKVTSPQLGDAGHDGG